MTTAAYYPKSGQVRTPAPVNIWRILLGDDPTLRADTLALYDCLTAQMGQVGLGRVIVMDYPMLLKDSTPLLVTWWLLNTIADRELYSTPLAAATNVPTGTPAAWTNETYSSTPAPYAEVRDGLSEKLREAV